MKGSDFIAQFLVDQGCTHSFVLTGGACAHMIDSLARHKDMKIVCVQHEQAGAMAADGYSRNGEGKLGVAMGTSGPGATNLLTGIACSWFDSIPVIYITGQVNTFEQRGDLKIRQMGFQETDIVSMAKPITKFAKKVERPEDLKKDLEEAFYWAKEGRPGPVLIDIPFNAQTAELDFSSTPGFNTSISTKVAADVGLFNKIMGQLEKAQRPTLLLGYGVRAAGADRLVLELVERLKIPVVASWSGVDLLPADHPNYVGQIGVYGARSANFAVQNSDFLLSIGSRLDSRQTGGNFKSFAREAYRVIVDIDESELKKGRVEAHLPVCMDARDFIGTLLENLPENNQKEHGHWVETTQAWKRELPVYNKSEVYSDTVNPYRFFDEFSNEVESNAFVSADTGANLTWAIQAFAPKLGQRVTSAYGNSPMGYSLPGAIGAWFANQRPVYCVIGDGGFQINLQELQTLVFYKVPLKILLFNNGGYGIIKQFQDLYLEGRHFATGEGYSCPDFGKLASAYDIPYFRLKNDSGISSSLNFLKDQTGPCLLDINILPTQQLVPKLGWGRPIEDQLPLLDRDQFSKYMFIEPLELSKSSGNEIN